MEDRLEVLNKKHVGLAWGFQVNPSSCSNPTHYENYIRLCAISDMDDGIGTTHVLIRNNNGTDKLLGYITLRATSYIQREEKIFHGNPAVEIFELAVSKDAERQGIGSTLVKFAMAKTLWMREELIGSQYIMLCADEQAVPFYKRMGFAELKEQGEVPRENWNVDCVPMFVKLPPTSAWKTE